MESQYLFASLQQIACSATGSIRLNCHVCTDKHIYNNISAMYDSSDEHLCDYIYYISLLQISPITVVSLFII